MQLAAIGQNNYSMNKNNTSFGMKLHLNTDGLGRIINQKDMSYIDKEALMHQSILAVNEINTKKAGVSLIDQIFSKAMKKAGVENGVGFEDLIPGYKEERIPLHISTDVVAEDNRDEFRAFNVAIVDKLGDSFGSEAIFNNKAEGDHPFFGLFKEVPVIGSKFKRLITDALKKYADVTVSEAWEKKLESEAKTRFETLCKSE